MATWRRSGLARQWATARLQMAAVLAVLTSSAALAQLSGEILVGRAANSLVLNQSASPQSASPASPPLAGDLAEPQPVVLPQPLYPRGARAARQEGRVMVCFTLDERGMVHAPAVRESTDAVFNQPVLDAISASRFTPARAGKQPIRSTACRTYKFVLR